MSAPFEKFSVWRKWFAGEFGIVVTVPDLEGDSLKDWRTDTRRFIEAAIQEKLQRERETPQP